MSLSYEQILSWVAVVIIIAYLAGFLFIFSRMVNFRLKMRKKLIAISILFAEKKEVLLNFYSLLLDKGAVSDEKDAELLARIRWQRMDVRKGEKAIEMRDMLIEANKRISYTVMKEKFDNDPKVMSYFETLNDIDVSYRRIVANYNNDLVAYEYWRQRKIYTWIFWLLFFRKSPRLS